MAECDEWQESEPAPAHQNSSSGRTFRPSRGRGGPRTDDRRENTNWRSRDAGDSRGFRGNGANDRQNYQRRGDNPDSGGNRKVISVPSSKVGRIIGKGGSKIRELEYESDAKVKIGDSSGEETNITLSGADEAVAKAEDMINDLLKDYAPRAPREN